MVHSWLHLLLMVTAALVGCELVEAPAPPTAERRALSGPELDVQSASPGPAGTDRRESVEVSWRTAAGQLEPLRFPRPVVSALAWNDAAIVVDRRREMWRVERDGARERLGRDVIGTPVTSGDGQWLAYVEGRDLEAEVRLRGGEGGPRVMAQGVQSAGALRFFNEDRSLLFVGSRPGGVAGLFIVDLDALRPNARCLTNCSLRAGRTWTEPFLPPPGDIRAAEIDGDRIIWELGGQRLEAELNREEAP